MAHSLKPGDIVACSWGYDQTNVNFFQVLAATEKTVTVREIEAEAVPGSEGFMCDECVPRPGVFTARSKPLRKRVLDTGEKNPRYRLRFDYGSTGYLWDGKPLHRSWYA